MDDNELSRALGETPSEYKLEDVDPIFKDLGTAPSPQPSSYSSGQSDPIVGGALGLLGAGYGYRERGQAVKMAKEAAQRNQMAVAIEELKEQLKSQGAYERASQGAKEELTGTTGRARQETYNTESARRAQASKGIDNPFTKRPWGSTDAGLLVEPATADELKLKKLQSAKSAQTVEMIKNMLSAPIRSAADYIARSKLLGALSGGMAGIEGYEAYKSFEQGDTEGAVTHGLQALGGAIGTIPTVPTALVGAGIAAAPTIYNKFKSRPVDPRYQAPVSQQDIEGASGAYYGRSPRNRLARSGLDPLS
jgi:hypothetical protein